MDRRTFLLLMAEAAAAVQLAQGAGAGHTQAADAEDALEFDLREVPFSYAGSYLTVSHDAGGDADLPVRLATVRKTAATNEMVRRLILLGSKEDRRSRFDKEDHRYGDTVRWHRPG